MKKWKDLHVQIEGDLYEFLKDEAHKDKISLGVVVRTILRLHWLKKKQEETL